MKKLILILTSMISLSALAEPYDPSAITLANRITGCADSFAEMVSKQGYKIIAAEETAMGATVKTPGDIRTLRTVTTVTLGKDFKPMQGYSQTAAIEISAEMTCIGRPAVVGRCSEVITGCVLK